MFFYVFFMWLKTIYTLHLKWSNLTWPASVISFQSWYLRKSISSIKSKKPRTWNHYFNTEDYNFDIINNNLRFYCFEPINIDFRFIRSHILAGFKISPRRKILENQFRAHWFLIFSSSCYISPQVTSSLCH